MSTNHQQEIDALVAGSIHASKAPANEQAELQARFEAVQRLAQESKAAHERFHAHRIVDAPKDDDTEEYIRWQVIERRLCRATIDAQAAYHAACDQFFLNSAERQQ